METSNQVLHPSWTDRAPYRSEAAAPAVLPRARRRFLRNEPASRFAWSTVAARLQSKLPSGRITNLHQRSRFPVYARKVRVRARSGLAAWQQLVLAAYIQKHIAESITVRALARFVYLNSQHFSRAFKTSFGMPPYRYVIAQRIERAKALLTGSAWSVSEIGLALGFSQHSSFSRAFRRITKISPTEYRMSQRGFQVIYGKGV